MAVAACCCGVPMSYCKPSRRVSAGTQTDRSRCSDTGEAGLSHTEQISENCQQLHARPLRDFDTSVHAFAGPIFFFHDPFTRCCWSHRGAEYLLYHAASRTERWPGSFGTCTRHAMGDMVAAVITRAVQIRC